MLQFNSFKVEQDFIYASLTFKDKKNLLLLLKSRMATKISSNAKITYFFVANKEYLQYKRIFWAQADTF